jgi:hypothetical protein
MFFDYGKIKREEYLKNNRFHKENGPAMVIYQNRYNKRLIWYQNGGIHRLDGPAYMEFKKNKLKKTKETKHIWYINGRVHREDGPAITWSKVNYQFNRGFNRHNVEIWTQNNRYHRQQCRFHTIVNKDGIRVEEWYPDETWIQNEPAITESFNGVPFLQKWYISGELRRQVSRLDVVNFPNPMYSTLLKFK